MLSYSIYNLSFIFQQVFLALEQYLVEYFQRSLERNMEGSAFQSQDIALIYLCQCNLLKQKIILVELEMQLLIFKSVKLLIDIFG